MAVLRPATSSLRFKMILRAAPSCSKSSDWSATRCKEYLSQEICSGGAPRIAVCSDTYWVAFCAPSCSTVWSRLLICSNESVSIRRRSLGNPCLSKILSRNCVVGWLSGTIGAEVGSVVLASPTSSIVMSAMVAARSDLTLVSLAVTSSISICRARIFSCSSTSDRLAASISSRLFCRDCAYSSARSRAAASSTCRACSTFASDSSAAAFNCANVSSRTFDPASRSLNPRSRLSCFV